MNAIGAFLSALTGAGAHFVLYMNGFSANPAVTATWGLLSSAAIGLIAVAIAAAAVRKVEVGLGSGTEI